MAAMYACGYDFETMKEMINKYYKSLSSIEKMPIIKSIGGYIFKKSINLEGLSNGEKIETLMNTLSRREKYRKYKRCKNSTSYCNL